MVELDGLIGQLDSFLLNSPSKGLVDLRLEQTGSVCSRPPNVKAIAVHSASLKSLFIGIRRLYGANDID